MSSKAATVEPELIESQVPVVTGLEAQTRGEIDIQIATAKRYPRSVTKAMQNAMSLATMSEEIAESCFYAKPQDGQTVEGPSARLAEIMASCWGHMRSEARIVEEAEKHIVARGTSWDLETNVAVAFEVRRRITKRDGKRYSEDMVVTASNAANSIAYRNTVFRVIPKAFWQPVYLAARQAAVGKAETLVNKRAKMMAYFAKLGVTDARVFSVIGVRGLDDITLEHLATLKGLATAIKDGDTTIEEAFPLQPSEPQRKAPEPTQTAAAPTTSAAAPTGNAPAGAPPATSAAPARETPAPPVAPPASPAASSNAEPTAERLRGMRITDTMVVEDPKDRTKKHFEITAESTIDGEIVVFVTRVQGIYDQAATCEGAQDLFTLVFVWGQRDSKAGKVRVRVLVAIEANDQPADDGFALDGGGES